MKRSGPRPCIGVFEEKELGGVGHGARQMGERGKKKVNLDTVKSAENRWGAGRLEKKRGGRRTGQSGRKKSQSSEKTKKPKTKRT